MTPTLELYDRARDAIRTRGFDADVQTKIALFVGAARSINAAILAAGELQPQVTVIFPFIHGQYFRELEFVTLLARVTRWSSDWAVYGDGMVVASPLWAAWWRTQLRAGPAFDPAAGYAALALVHALLARVRLTPVIPDDANDLDPFVVALRRMEQESGRMIQSQIRLLKDAPTPLGRAEAERVIESQQSTVDDAFHRFLEWLGNRPSAGALQGAWTRPASIAADQRFDVGSWLTRIMTGRIDA